jgi:GntR family transcriptional regulator, rspAB operon transcriptional repressor
MPEIAHIQRESLGEKVYLRLRDKILSREFQRDDKLNIYQLAEQMGVSRSPVKEAFNRLALEGLLEIRPNAGTFVKSLTADDMADIFEFRSIIEVWAVGEGIKKFTDEGMRLIEEVVQSSKLLFVDTDEESFNYNVFLELDTQFHRLIMQHSGNRKIVEVYDTLHAHLQIARFSYANGRDRSLVSQREHERILQAYKKHDVRKVKHELKNHIQRNMDDLLHIMDEIGGII